MRVSGALVHEIPPLESAGVFGSAVSVLPGLQEKKGLGEVSFLDGLMGEVDVGDILVKPCFLGILKSLFPFAFGNHPEAAFGFLGLAGTEGKEEAENGGDDQGDQEE